MPRPPTARENLLHAVDQAALSLANLQHQHILLDDQSSDFWSDSESESDTNSLAFSMSSLNDGDITTMSLSSLSTTGSTVHSGISNSDLSSDEFDQGYN